MEFVVFIIRLFLATVLILAGIGKLLDIDGSKKALEGFGVPDYFSKQFGILLPILEISLAALLLFGVTSWFGAIGASLLLSIFIGGILWQMKLGKSPDCHCFGQIHSEPVGQKTLWRNVVFLLLALGLVMSGKENQGLQWSEIATTKSEIMQLFFAFVIIGLLGILFFYIKKISAEQTKILRHLEGLEIVSNGAKGKEREDVKSPKTGLPIGSPIAQFTLPSADGRRVKFEELLARGKPILFFNVSPSCKPCEALLSKIQGWETELSDQISFVFLSNGSKSKNIKKFAGESTRDILIQEDKEIAELLEIKWTPTALLVNATGQVASYTAAGDIAIGKLINEIKSKDLKDEFVNLATAKDNGFEVKIGEKAPEFSVRDLNGRQHSTKDLNENKTLVTFWSMDCSHCLGMIDEIATWEENKKDDDPNMLFFSDGKAEDHEGLKFNSPVILDKDYEISQKFGMFGTPSAVLVNKDGKIISETAVGTGEIRALTGRRMNK